MGLIRFLHNNLIEADGVAITASSTATAQISGIQKNGTGSGSIVPEGTYTGTSETTYIILIDGAGDVGTATFAWSDDNGTTFGGDHILTSLVAIALSDGITVRFTIGTGTDFVLGDRFDYKIVLLWGASRLIDRDRNTEFRTANVVGAKTWTFDLGSAQAVQALVIQDHNFTNEPPTITLAADADPPNWGAPTFGPVAVPWANAKILYYLTQTFQWWRLSVTNAANTDGYLRMSSIFLGPYSELSNNFQYGIQRGKDPLMDGSLADLHPAVSVLGLPDTAQISFGVISDTDRDTIVETIYPGLYNASTRRVLPMWINWDSADLADESLYYWDGPAISKGRSWDSGANGPLYDISLRFREAMRALI